LRRAPEIGANIAARNAQRTILSDYAALATPSARKPSPAIVKLQTKAADETRCRRALVKMMLAEPDRPIPKSELETLFGLGPRPFERVFKAAVDESGALAWSKPGPRSNRITSRVNRDGVF
jgi:transcriptional regulator GlxA family with amidase domain